MRRKMNPKLGTNICQWQYSSVSHIYLALNKYLPIKFCTVFLPCLNPSRPDPARKEKIRLNFYFHTFHRPEAYLGLSQISMMVHFCEISQLLKAVNYLHKNSPSYIFDRIPNMPLLKPFKIFFRRFEVFWTKLLVILA